MGNNVVCIQITYRANTYAMIPYTTQPRRDYHEKQNKVYDMQPHNDAELTL